MRWCLACLVAHFALVQPAAAASIHDTTKKGDVAPIAALDAGADVNEVDGVTALYIASNDGNVKVGRCKASASDFQYSVTLREAGGSWTFEDLNAWISGPALYFPGTEMIFEGLEDEKQRADVIAYLRTLSDQPEPLP